MSSLTRSSSARASPSHQDDEQVAGAVGDGGAAGAGCHGRSFLRVALGWRGAVLRQRVPADDVADDVGGLLGR